MARAKSFKRIHCYTCERETLHNGWICIHCDTNSCRPNTNFMRIRNKIKSMNSNRPGSGSQWYRQASNNKESLEYKRAERLAMPDHVGKNLHRR